MPSDHPNPDLARPSSARVGGVEPSTRFDAGGRPRRSVDAAHAVSHLAGVRRRAGSPAAAGDRGRSADGRQVAGGTPGTPPTGIPVAGRTWRRGRNVLVARTLLTHLILIGVPMGTGAVMDLALGGTGGVASGGAALIDGIPFVESYAALFVGRALSWMVVIAGLAFAIGLAGREWRRSASVVSADGMVDPRDGRAVDPDAPAAVEARAYWWTWLVTGESPALFDRRRADARSGRPTSSAVIVVDTVRSLALPVALVLAAPVIAIIFAGGSAITALAVPAAACALMIAVHVLPRLSVPAEVPTSRCLECGHRRMAGAERCTECGHAPGEDEAATARRRSGSRRATAGRAARRDDRTRRTTAGLGLIIAGAWVVSLFGLDPAVRALRTSRAMPSHAIIADLQSREAWDAERFAALVGRPLDRAARERLAGALLKRRDVGAETRPSAWAWFDAQAASGTLDPATINDRWAGRVEPTALVAGPPDRDGRVRHLGLRFLRRIEPGANDRAGFVIRSVRIDGGEPWTPTDRHGQPALVLRGRPPANADWLPVRDQWTRPWPAPPEEIALLPLRDALPLDTTVAVEIELVRFVVGSPEVDVTYDARGDAVPRGDVIWSEAMTWRTKLRPLEAPFVGTPIRNPVRD